MKELIEELYGFKVLGTIKVSEKVYKIKCEDRALYVKFVDDMYLSNIYDYIESLHLKCFVYILKNKNNEILTSIDQTYFYVMECLLDSKSQLKEIKLKFYFELLSYIHSHSSYHLKVSHDYFKRLNSDILHIIEEREYYYLSLMEKCESTIYRSPSEWLFLLNFYRIENKLSKAKEFLQQCMSMMKDLTKIRVCLIYNHFDYDHISLKSRKLLSIDKMKIDIPIYDIFDIYSHLPDILFDIDCLSQGYLQTIELFPYEKILLCCLLNVVPLIYIDNNEIDNIIKISRLLYYMDSIDSLCHQLEGENK